MKQYTLINKKFILSKNAQISVQERACKFGDGVFETLKIHNYKIYDFRNHFLRLKKGLKAFKIDAKIDDLKKLSLSLIDKNQIQNGILRISISRGIGSMGYLPKENIQPLIIIETISPKKVDKNKKITIGISKIKLLKQQDFLKNCKTMQSINYVLAKIEARKKGFFDDIMLNQQGFIGESSSSNLFFVKNNKIYTPSLKCDILGGTVRKKILEKFPMKISQIEFKLSKLKNVDEIFLTNSNLLVLGVDEIIISKKKIALKKEISNKILKFLENDVEKNCK